MFHAAACCHPSTSSKHYIVKHARRPCRFVILATKALYSQASRQVDVYTSHIHGILMRVASGLFSWSMVAGLLAFSSRQCALTINHGPLSASHYFPFLSKRSGRRMPPAERSALYNIHSRHLWYTVVLCQVPDNAWSENVMTVLVLIFILKC